ncbi:hypothetical protein L0Y65_00700 [Candidatus Micrarchaeota archaeon]|nr:hypothetical protein [Candidatus Micrarchaeota archaeon]
MDFRRIAFLLVLAMPSVFAAGTDLAFMVPAIAIIVLISLSLSSMLAASIQNPQLEAWAKTELQELLVGAVLIGIIIAFFLGSDAISILMTGEPDYVNKAGLIAEGWVSALMAPYGDIIEAATRIKVAASYTSGFSLPIWIISFNYQTGPLAGASIFFQPLMLAAQGISNAIFLSQAVSLLVSFFKIVVPKVLLPLSLSVRLIPFTRRLGNTLIALSLGAIVFFPMSVIIADFFNGQIAPPAPAIADLGKLDADPYPIYVFGPICEFAPLRILFSLTDPLFSLIVCLPTLVFPAVFPVCFELVWNVIYPIISMIFQIVNTILLIAWEASVTPSDYGGDVYDQVMPFLADVNNLVMVIYLDFVFIVLFTIAGTRSIAAALGGEGYMAGIQRML